MNCKVEIDWKFAVALGAVVVGIIFSVKMDASAIERVSTVLAETLRDVTVARNGNR